MIQNVQCSQSSTMPGMVTETVTADITPPSAGAVMNGQPTATLKNCATGQIVGNQNMNLVSGTSNHYSAVFGAAQGPQYCASVAVTWTVMSQIAEQGGPCNCA